MAIARSAVMGMAAGVIVALVALSSCNPGARLSERGSAMPTQPSRAGIPAAAASSTATTAGRPNIVVVMTDDMRVSELAYMPSLRRLVSATGVRFANSFSPDPLCCPARASFLTGEYSHNHGVTSNGLTGIWGGFGKFDDSHTLAVRLRSSGYHTGFIGKYLNNYGFATSRVTGGPSLHYVPAGWTDWYAAVEPPAGSAIHGSTFNYFDTPFNINGVIDNGHSGQYQTGVIGGFARNLVAKYHRSPRPFFLWVSFVAPHTGQPYEEGDVDFVRGSTGRLSDTRTPARPDWVRGRFNGRIHRAAGLPIGGGPAEGNMRDKPSFMRSWPELNTAERRAVRASTRQRAEAMYVVDRQIAGLIHTLRRTGEWRNTVFVFVSDNGYFLGEHRQRSGKVKAHEPSLRVPLLMTGPGIPGAQVRYDPVTIVDLNPTILDLAHLTAPRGCDAVSKLPIIRRGDRGWTTPVVTEGRVLAGRLLHGRAPGFRLGLTSIGLRTAQYSFIRYSDGEQELYDLRVDPNELRNVAKSRTYNAVLAEFRALWWRYKSCSAATCRTPLPASLTASPMRERKLTTTYWAAVHARYGGYRGDRI